MVPASGQRGVADILHPGRRDLAVLVPQDALRVGAGHHLPRLGHQVGPPRAADLQPAEETRDGVQLDVDAHHVRAASVQVGTRPVHGGGDAGQALGGEDVDAGPEHVADGAGAGEPGAGAGVVGVRRVQPAGGDDAGGVPGGPLHRSFAWEVFAGHLFAGRAAGGLHEDALRLGPAGWSVEGAADQHEVAQPVGEQHVGDLRRFLQHRGGEDLGFRGMVRGAAAAQHAVRQQGGARGGFEVGGHLQRDPLLEAVQQGVRQAEHAGAVGAVGIQRDAEQKADDEADAAERQANA